MRSIIGVNLVKEPSRVCIGHFFDKANSCNVTKSLGILTVQPKYPHFHSIGEFIACRDAAAARLRSAGGDESGFYVIPGQSLMGETEC